MLPSTWQEREGGRESGSKPNHSACIHRSFPMEKHTGKCTQRTDHCPIPTAHYIFSLHVSVAYAQSSTTRYVSCSVHSRTYLLPLHADLSARATRLMLVSPQRRPTQNRTF